MEEVWVKKEIEIMGIEWRNPAIDSKKSWPSDYWDTISHSHVVVAVTEAAHDPTARAAWPGCPTKR